MVSQYLLHTHCVTLGFYGKTPVNLRQVSPPGAYGSVSREAGVKASFFREAGAWPCSSRSLFVSQTDARIKNYVLVNVSMLNNASKSSKMIAADSKDDVLRV